MELTWALLALAGAVLVGLGLHGWWRARQAARGQGPGPRPERPSRLPVLVDRVDPPMDTVPSASLRTVSFNRGKRSRGASASNDGSSHDSANSPAGATDTRIRRWSAASKRNTRSPERKSFTSPRSVRVWPTRVVFGRAASGRAASFSPKAPSVF